MSYGILLQNNALVVYQVKKNITFKLENANVYWVIKILMEFASFVLESFYGIQFKNSVTNALLINILIQILIFANVVLLGILLILFLINAIVVQLKNDF